MHAVVMATSSAALEATTDSIVHDSDTLELARRAFAVPEAPPLDEALCEELIARTKLPKVIDVVKALQGGGVHRVDELIGCLCREFSSTAYHAIDGEFRAEAFAAVRRMPPSVASSEKVPQYPIPNWAVNKRTGSAPLRARGIAVEGLPVAIGIDPKPVAFGIDPKGSNSQPGGDVAADDVEAASAERSPPAGTGAPPPPEPSAPHPDADMGVPKETTDPSAAASAGMSDVEQEVSIPGVCPEPLASSHAPEPPRRGGISGDHTAALRAAAALTLSPPPVDGHLPPRRCHPVRSVQTSLTCDARPLLAGGRRATDLRFRQHRRKHRQKQDRQSPRPCALAFRSALDSAQPANASPLAFRSASHASTAVLCSLSDCFERKLLCCARHTAAGLRTN